MSFTLCSSEAIVISAGANVNTDASTSNAILVQISDNVEGTINSMTRYNWNDASAAINDDVKGILSDTACSLGGIKLIQYDMGGYTSRGEAESMINVLRDTALRNLQILRDIKVQTFIEEA